MAINLSRSTRLFVSTVKTGNAPANTYEIKILDGYSFSQSVQTQEIVLEEASCTPVRGAKTFNTALDPVDVSVPLYMKPYKDASNFTNAVENKLWEAFAGPGGGVSVTPGTPSMSVDFLKSDTHTLEVLQLFFQLENTTYLVEDVTLGTAEIDFAIDQIAQIVFSGTGAAISEVDTSGWVAGTDYTAEPTLNKKLIRNKLSTIKMYKDSDVSTSGWQIADYQGALATGVASDLANGTTYTATAVVDGVSKPLSYTATGSDLISAIITDIDTDLGASGALTVNARGDLQITSATTGTTSTVVITDVDLFSSIKVANYQGLNTSLDGVVAGKQYFFGITGGSITLENNINSLVPEELGIVNQPLAAFAGARSFTGTLTAYLNTGANKTSGLLADLLADVNATTNRFYLNVQIGGCATNPKVEIIMPYAQISIPTVDVQDVISTEIAFSAAGSEITQSDELTLNYYADLT